MTHTSQLLSKIAARFRRAYLASPFFPLSWIHTGKRRPIMLKNRLPDILLNTFGSQAVWIPKLDLLSFPNLHCYHMDMTKMSKSEMFLFLVD